MTHVAIVFVRYMMIALEQRKDEFLVFSNSVQAFAANLMFLLVLLQQAEHLL